MTAPVEWYFDFISPYAYLQHFRIGEFPQARLVYRPVLLAGMLGHWGQKGPAEIPAKRLFTYRFVRWYAERLGQPLRFPPGHPFNPLRALRLCLALDCSAAVVDRLFAYLWRDGQDLDDDQAFIALGQELGLADPLAAIAAEPIKRQLRANTEAAIAAGVFGVPTLAIEGQLFFGNDATDMALAYLADPDLFDSPEMLRLATLPQAASRTGA